MRIINTRLLQLLPGLQIFLDVECPDLDLAKLEEYVAASETVLVLYANGIQPWEPCENTALTC